MAALGAKGLDFARGNLPSAAAQVIAGLRIESTADYWPARADFRFHALPGKTRRGRKRR
jgi:hypothetical protein